MGERADDDPRFMFMASKFGTMLSASPALQEAIEEAGLIIGGYGKCFEEGGMEPPGCELYDDQLVDDILGAFKRYEARSKARHDG